MKRQLRIRERSCQPLRRVWSVWAGALLCWTFQSSQSAVQVGAQSTRAVLASEVKTFRNQGHVALRGLLAPTRLRQLREQVAEAKKAGEAAAKQHALRTAMQLREPESSSIAVFDTCLSGATSFLQYFNLWQTSPGLGDFARSLGHVAAPLLGTETIQLYGDTLFVKQQNSRGTSWHVDLDHVPLETTEFLTFWMPLQAVPGIDDLGSPLIFVDESHVQSHLVADARLRSHGPLKPGDVTVHHGGTLHAAPSLNGMAGERWAWAVSFFAHGATVKHLPVEDEEREAHQVWAGSLPNGAVAKHELLPKLHATLNTSVQAAAEGVPESHGTQRWLQFYLGVLLADRGRPLEAERCWRSLLGTGNDDISSRLTVALSHRLGLLLHDTGRLKDAEPWLSRAATLAEQLPDMLQAELAEFMTDLGLLKRDCGDAELAEQMLRRALICREECLGASHRDTLVSVYNLADVLEELGRIAEARELFERELSWCKSFLGDDHGETLVSKRSLERFSKKNFDK